MRTPALGGPHADLRERALATALTGVASELRLIEAADFVAFIRTGQVGNIRALVASAAELHFVPGALAVGMLGSAELAWHGSPRIALDMQFHHDGVAAYFRLFLGASEAAVALDYLSVSPVVRCAEQETRRLVAALEGARLQPPARKAGASQPLYS